MSASSTEVAHGTRGAFVRQGAGGVPIFLLALAGATIAAGVPLVGRLGEDTHGFGLFAALAAASALAHYFIVWTPGRLPYHAGVAFVIPAALLLPPELVLLMAVLPQLPKWLEQRHSLATGSFAIVTSALAGLAAWGAAQTFFGLEMMGSQERWALGGLAAASVYLLVNHALLAVMIRLAPAYRLAGVAVFSATSLATDAVLAAAAVGVAAVWRADPWLLPVAVAPLLLIQRLLSVPELQLEARIDAKTGLFNARHFGRVLTQELARAERFGRPLSLLVIDLDHLRDLNNEHGHLAGDDVLQGLATVFRSALRDQDVPARFGGEEFTVLLPETEHEQALEIAERLRLGVEEHAFAARTTSHHLRVTVSVGVASFPSHAVTTSQLVHVADVAVYEAKQGGRNRVVSASSAAIPDEPFDGGTAAQLALPPQAQLLVLPAARAKPRVERRRHPRPRPLPRFERLGHNGGFSTLVLLVTVLATAAGALSIFLSGPDEIGLVGLVTTVVMVGLGQVLAIRVREAELAGPPAAARASARSRESAYDRVRRGAAQALERLSATLDERDANASGHSRRVRRYALMVGRELRLTPAQLDQLGHAAILHDIGKAG
ncbi:MAG: diguanylate cyclase, partial [Actinobacteria bacterium]|nr:diguanylate cyclase [Actinomycetota bacterium]